ncbi:GH116 family glycosyl hydrolase [Agarivorans sp. QJM3NY_33]|uniref:GH116 family glycosyl hydrolase n=1 Tax=Agarivorans sp. QJM3NY_33 TaxID=3421432 RepID=UPI003D7D51A6
MKIEQYLAASSLRGSVAELMAPGLASEFVQPWYQPLPTTPLTTGMAMGGIGNTYSLSISGCSPVFNFLPGIQVRAERNDSLRMADFYFSEQDELRVGELRIIEPADFIQQISLYPLLDDQGQVLFSPDQSQAQWLAGLQRLLDEPQLYAWNKQRLADWKIHLDRNLKLALSTGQVDRRANCQLLLKYFGGSVQEQCFQRSLIADCEADSYLKQPAWPAEQIQYQGLYPVAQSDYSGAVLQLSKTHYSFIEADNEALCRLPVSLTQFCVHNPSQRTQRFNLVQVQENLIGFQVTKERVGSQDASFMLVRQARQQQGELFSERCEQGQRISLLMSGESYQDCLGEMALSLQAPAQCQLSANHCFYTAHADKVVAQALAGGGLSGQSKRGIYSGRELCSSALQLTATLAPGETLQFCFMTVLDLPQVEMNGLSSEKAYVRQFPQAKQRALAIARFAWSKQQDYLQQAFAGLWKRAQFSQQEDPQLRQQLTTMALNSLSFLAEATVWDKQDRFLIRECVDYPFFNSLDVYFYGSFSLLSLLPRLDGEVMRRFADAVLADDFRQRRHHIYTEEPYAELSHPKYQAERAIRGAVCHDLGSPFDCRPDAYDWHNVKEWKDLAPKFVLMVLRHVSLFDDPTLLEDCWPAVQQAMNYLEKMIEPGQQFPLTNGTDDTFDNLRSHGISCYSGSLWLAALQACASLAKLRGAELLAEQYRQRLAVAKQQFDDSLWDEQQGYYLFYVTPLRASQVDRQQLPQLAEHFSLLSQQAYQQTSLSELVVAINHWLNQPLLFPSLTEDQQALWQRHWNCPWPEQAGKLAQRRLKKLLLLNGGGDWCLQGEQWLVLDSDDIFADQLLADSYLRWLGQEALFEQARCQRVLQHVYQYNYRLNSPRVGAANLVKHNGAPKAWDNFQAHDVWIGVQYSLALAMQQHHQPQSEELLASVYRLLYQSAQIPFAAPEGFNATVRLQAQDLPTWLSASERDDLLAALKQHGLLQADGRVAGDLSEDFGQFSQDYASLFAEWLLDCGEIFRLLHATALKYTAGRYLRPGMIFALADQHQG